MTMTMTMTITITMTMTITMTITIVEMEMEILNSGFLERPTTRPQTARHPGLRLEAGPR